MTKATLKPLNGELIAAEVEDSRMFPRYVRLEGTTFIYTHANPAAMLPGTTLCFYEVPCCTEAVRITKETINT